MSQFGDIPIGENSQGDKRLNLISYLKKSQKIWSQKTSPSQKN